MADIQWLMVSLRHCLQAAVACAALGVCVDLYCVCPSPLGLQVLEPLPAGTGGHSVVLPRCTPIPWLSPCNVP